MVRYLGAGFLVAAAVAFTGPAAAVELITNGGFETGFAAWSRSSALGSAGDFHLSAPGSATPLTGSPTPANSAGGDLYAVTDAEGPGAYALRQSFVVPVGATSTSVSFQFFAQSAADLFIPSVGLDYSTPELSQYARIDILTAGASAFSTAAADIVTNLYIGHQGTPGAYTNFALDLGSLLTPGASYQIRFAEADNVFFFNLGVDNVSVQANFGAPVPEPATWAMLIAGLGAVGAAVRARRSRSLPARA